ncbi:MAG: hypothetical protein WCH65_05200 [bacterium]
MSTSEVLQLICNKVFFCDARVFTHVSLNIYCVVVCTGGTRSGATIFASVVATLPAKVHQKAKKLSNKRESFFIRKYTKNKKVSFTLYYE